MNFCTQIFRHVRNRFCKRIDAEKDYFTPILSIAEGACEVIKQKGLENFLLKEYEADARFLSSARYYDEASIRNDIGSALCSMLGFLGLSPVVNFVVECVGDSEDNLAGQYSSGAYNKTITIKFRKYYSPVNILAILSHECTHYFMEHHKLNWNDTELNEQRTDVIANLIGFNAIMRRGYRSVNTPDGFTHKIGYITSEDCNDIGQFLKHQRKVISDKLAAEKLISNLKQEIKKNLEAAKSLLRLLDYIDISEINTNSEQDIYTIQQILLEKESRNIQAEIQHHEDRLLDNINTAQLTLESQEINKLCIKLLSWLSTLQQYGKSL